MSVKFGNSMKKRLGAKENEKNALYCKFKKVIVKLHGRFKNNSDDYSKRVWSNNKSFLLPNDSHHVNAEMMTQDCDEAPAIVYVTNTSKTEKQTTEKKHLSGRINITSLDSTELTKENIDCEPSLANNKQARFKEQKNKEAVTLNKLTLEDMSTHQMIAIFDQESDRLKVEMKRLTSQELQNNNQLNFTMRDSIIWKPKTHTKNKSNAAEPLQNSNSSKVSVQTNIVAEYLDTTITELQNQYSDVTVSWWIEEAQYNNLFQVSHYC